MPTAANAARGTRMLYLDDSGAISPKRSRNRRALCLIDEGPRADPPVGAADPPNGS